MTLTEMTTAARVGEQVDLEPGWGQGRATFGGLSGALLVARMRGQVADESKPLRTMTALLLAPVAPGPVQLRADVLRAGRSVALVAATMHQDGAVVATAQAAFGAARASMVELPGTGRVPRPHFPAPESLQPIVFEPGLTPDFFQHVDLRPAVGNLPFSGADEPDFGGWMS